MGKLIIISDSALDEYLLRQVVNGNSIKEIDNSVGCIQGTRRKFSSNSIYTYATLSSVDLPEYILLNTKPIIVSDIKIIYKTVNFIIENNGIPVLLTFGNEKLIDDDLVNKLWDYYFNSDKEVSFTVKKY